MTNNDIIRNIIIYITYIIILYVIIEEIYNITVFTFNYNSSFDYGLMLRKMCNNEYFEYETERFQLATNTINLKLNNDIYNKKNYMIIILIMSILITVIISFMFARLFYHNFIEDYNCVKFDNDADNPNAVYSTFKQVILCFCPMCGELTDCTATYIVYLIIMILLPIYIILYLGLKIDIGFFNNNDLYYYYMIFFALLIILRLPIKYLNNLRHLNENSSMFLYFLYLLIYLSSYYYIANMITIYNNFSLEYTTYSEEKLDDEEKFYKYSDKEVLDTPDNNVIDVIGKFIGYYKGDVYDVNGIFMKNFSRFIFIIGIILIIIYILYLLIRRIKFLNILLNREEDYDIVYNYIIIPLLSLFFILITIHGTTLYNSYVNKYILYNPLMLYKNDLDKLYKSFDIILLNDSSALDDPKSVPLNVSYGVLHVLYSAVFKYNPMNERINNIQDTSKISDKNILLTAYLGRTTASSGTDKITYTTLNDFNFIKQILKQGTNKNIFINDDGKINNKVLLFVFLNLCPKTSTNPTENDYLLYGDIIKYNLKAALCNVMVMGKDPTGYHTLGSRTATNDLTTSNYYITEYNDKDQPIKGSRDNDLYLYNNKKKYDNFLYDYENLLENIKDEYINLIKKSYDLITDFIRQVEDCEDLTLSIDDISQRLKNDISLADEFVKNKYILLLMSILETTFNNVNFHLENNRKNRNVSKLSQYIISNYNNIFTDNNYINANLISKPTPYKIKYDADHKTDIDAKKLAFEQATTAKNEAELAKTNSISTDQTERGRLAADLKTKSATYITAKEAYFNAIAPYKSTAITSDRKFGDEYRARYTSDAADATSYGFIFISLAYLFILCEPFYIE
jgi:hypothetical protein